jgi:hypothetical protein
MTAYTHTESDHRSMENAPRLELCSACAGAPPPTALAGRHDLFRLLETGNAYRVDDYG